MVCRSSIVDITMDLFWTASIFSLSKRKKTFYRFLISHWGSWINFINFLKEDFSCTMVIRTVKEEQGWSINAVLKVTPIHIKVIPLHCNCKKEIIFEKFCFCLEKSDLTFLKDCCSIMGAIFWNQLKHMNLRFSPTCL